MPAPIRGIHHVTAIAGNPQTNLNFYGGVLGLRLVKQTVNFDDPTTYHLYYGDELGHPGTILTFFPWPGAPRGRRGTGQATATAFAVPPGSLDWWMERLAGEAVECGPVEDRLGQRVLPLEDADRLSIELIEQAGAEQRPFWRQGPVPGSQAIRGFHSVTITEEGYERTATLLSTVMGFHPAGSEGNRYRYTGGPDAAGTLVDVVCAPGLEAGRVAVGAVHHVAFRCANDEEQATWRARVAAEGLNVTPVMDRQYFKSIYFREPGGVLFEIATDPPGFTLDETPGTLGNALKLPPWLEPRRKYIEERLPELRRPKTPRRSR